MFDVSMPHPREPRNIARKKFFLNQLERRKILAISSVTNLIPALDALLSVLDDDKCLKRTGMQFVQLLFAASLLSMTKERIELHRLSEKSSLNRLR